VYLLRAGIKAERQYANPEAIGHFRRALELLASTSPSEFEEGVHREVAAQLHEGLGDVLGRIGHQVEAQEAYQRALAHLPQSDSIGQARLYRKTRAGWQSMGQHQAGLEACDRAEAALGARPDEPGLEWWREWIEIQLQRMEQYYWLGRWPVIAAAAEKTQPVVVCHGTALQRASFYGKLCRLHFRRDRYVVSDETLAYAQAGLAASLELADSVEIATNQFVLGFAYLCRGDFDAADAELQAALSLADRGYVLEVGQIMFSDTGRNLLGDDRVKRTYLGAD
jgi:tetratricopeptide (TPR) repeat protein